LVGAEASKALRLSVGGCGEEASRRMYQHRYVDKVLAGLTFERARKVGGLD